MDRKVRFTEDAARRVAAATLAYERSGRDQPPIHFRQVGDDAPRLRIGKTTATWEKGTAATISLYENGTPPDLTTSTETLAGCVNLWGNVAADKWVGVLEGPAGAPFLVVAEC